MQRVEPRPWSLDIRLRDQPEGARRYQVIADAPADGRSVRELHLGDEIWISLIVRDGRSLPVRADTALRAGDEVLVLADPEIQTDIERIFTSHTHEDRP
jgi:cell volume regulation protein A